MPKSTASWKPGQPDRPVGTAWKPGQSGNPGGKPVNVIAVSRKYLATQTRDGVELFEILLAIARDPAEKAADRKACATECIDRLMGKAPQLIGVNTAEMTPEQQALLAALQLTPHERRKELAEAESPTDEAADAP